jgi:hypothetical protein
MFCPNPNSKEFKDLVEKVGEDEAYHLWDRFEGEVPKSVIEAPGTVTLSKTESTALDTALTNILKELNVNVRNVDMITDANGKKLDAVAKASALKRVIEVVEGKKDATTLPEEAAHIILEMMDPDSHVFKSMFDKVIQYPVFNEVVQEYGETYQYDDTMLRKEAIAKILTREIMQLHAERSTANSQQSNYIVRWWNLVMSYLKKKINSIDTSKLDNAIKEHTPFKETAQALLDKNLNMFASPVFSDNAFYQLSNTKSLPVTEIQKTIMESIAANAKGMQIMGDNNDRAYYKDGKKLGESVTTRRDKKFKDRFKNSIQTKEGLKRKTESAKIGNLIHKDIDNIVKRLLVKDASVQRVVETDPVTYANLEAFVRKFGNTFPKGTVFISEQMIYHKTRNMPGTVDLIAISPTGEVSIFDWKTMDFTAEEVKEYKEPKYYKTEQYDWQISQYRETLSQPEYGITKFDKLRYVPIRRTYKYDRQTGERTYKGIEVGDPELKSDAKSYLNPVPVAGEKTGVEPIDKLIDELKALFDDLKKKGSTMSQAEKQKKQARSTALRKAMLGLQLKKSFEGYIENAYVEFATVDAMLKENQKTPLTESQLMDMKESLRIYTDISKKLAALKLKDKINEKEETRLKTVQAKAEEKVAMLEEILKERFIAAAKEAGVTDYTLNALQEKGYKPVGMMTRIFTSLSRIDHPLFRTLWNLVNKANIATRKATEDLAKETAEKVENYKKWASANGYSGSNMFEPMINRKTGKMISKFSPEFYKERNSRILKGDWQWIKNNVTVDEAGLKKYLEEQRNFIRTHTFSSDKTRNTRIKETKLKELETNFNVFEHNEAWLNPKGFFTRFTKPLDKWHSKEYQYLKANKPAFEFYEFFTGKMREFSQFLPLHKGDDWTNPDRFIPSIEKDLVENVTSNGGGSTVKGLGSNFIELFEYKASEDPMFGQVNEITGEKEMVVPVYYTSEIDPSRKSYDLGRVLLLFGKMAYNYKNMSEIEGTVRNLRQTLADSKESLVDGSGKIFKNPLSDKVVTKVIAADTLTSFNDFINYYVYGIKQKDNWGYFTKTKKVVNEETGEVEEVEMKGSWNKVAGAALRAFSAKALGLNLISAGANAFGGLSNTVIMSAGKQFFTKRQWAKSMAMATAGNFNPKTRMLMAYLNMTGEKDLAALGDDVSINNILRKPSYDNIFFLQSGTDTLIHNISALSLMQNFGVDKDGKVKRLDKLPEGSKSIMDMLEVKDGKFNITEVLSSEEFYKLRAKSQAIGEKMIGMSTRDNVSGFRMTMMGQALMQFRGWIPRTVGARFGETRYDAELEVVEEGRYWSLFRQLTLKRILPLTGELISGLTTGEFGQNTRDVVHLKYVKYLEENPTVDPNEVTEEMFYEMHVANVRSTMMEIALITAFMFLAMSLKAGWDDDDDMDKRTRNYATKMLNRTMDELLFYVNPDSLIAITKGALPVFGLLSDIKSFFSELVGQSVGFLTDDEEKMEKNKPGWRFARLLPGGSTMWMWFGDKQDR